MYTIRDYIGELSTNYGLPDEKQCLKSGLMNFQPDDCQQFKEENYHELYQLILSLNDYIRVNLKTHYKLHKSYPSPRSLYPVKVFISLGDHKYLTKDDISGEYLVYRNSKLKTSEGDIAIDFEDKYPEYYNHIKKSLFLLEIGHLLYNITTLALYGGFVYKLESNGHNLLLRLEEKNSGLINSSKFDAFMESCLLRNSGPYQYRITQTGIKAVNFDELNDFIEHRISELGVLFHPEIRSGVSAVCGVNDGMGNFHYRTTSDTGTVDYKQLNQIYPYINFYGVSFYVFFYLNHTNLSDDHLTPLILALGYLTQSICLKYASRERYCRPIKSFNIDEVEKLMKVDSASYTPYYLVISGGFE
ncbi:hypothetical protein [Paenibacillus caui]|uniref:hypothetical protein n=1 Tax=Paenibacillus caui TaxID=2873927 RepID=UPI001CAA2B91|nr:hypothetical protein [Paenibacillus caui]